MIEIYDVAVIGAGPAGAIFAKELALTSTDMKILLLDGSSKSDKVCGGLLAPDAQEALAKLGLTLPKEVLADPQIFAVETVDLGAEYTRCYQRHYLNMSRSDFDKWLVSLIPPTVNIIEARCRSIERSNGNYIIKIFGNDSEQLFFARSVVGADGGNSLVRRTLLNKKIPNYVSIQEWFKSEEVLNAENIPSYSCLFDKKTSDSCSWTIRKDGYIIFGGAFKKNGCRFAFEEQKARLENFFDIKFAKASKTEACLLTSPRRKKDFILGEPGVYLIGEAAGFISASSFEGISSAILSGKYLADAFSNRKEEKNILKAYRSKTRKLRIKLFFKIPKSKILCSPFLRGIIMKSGIKSIKKYKRK